jgi:hypothetical protein
MAAWLEAFDGFGYLAAFMVAWALLIVVGNALYHAARGGRDG